MQFGFAVPFAATFSHALTEALGALDEGRDTIAEELAAGFEVAGGLITTHAATNPPSTYYVKVEGDKSGGAVRVTTRTVDGEEVHSAHETAEYGSGPKVTAETSAVKGSRKIVDPLVDARPGGETPKASETTTGEDRRSSSESSQAEPPLP